MGDDSLSGGGRSLLPLHLRDGEGESLLPSSRWNVGVEERSHVGSQLRCELTGVKGRRTKYQTFDTSQLIVSADR